jgi:hypothetical protein
MLPPSLKDCFLVMKIKGGMDLRRQQFRWLRTLVTNRMVSTFGGNLQSFFVVVVGSEMQSHDKLRDFP